jgi:hypothetical protein
MMASRGMGAIRKGVVKKRRDNTDFTEYAEGGRVNEAGNYTKPGMRKSLFESIKGQATQGTAAGQWSARKAQLLAKQYKAKGGKSGKPSSKTGERYLPKAAIESLTPSEYAATTKAKRAGKAAGKQFVKQPPKIAAKTARHR